MSFILSISQSMRIIKLLMIMFTNNTSYLTLKQSIHNLIRREYQEIYKYI